MPGRLRLRRRGAGEPPPRRRGRPFSRARAKAKPVGRKWWLEGAPSLHSASDPAQSIISFPTLDELDLVPIRVDHESDHRRSMLHRPRFATDHASLTLDLRAGCVGVVDLYRDMAKAL